MAQNDDDAGYDRSRRYMNRRVVMTGLGAAAVAAAALGGAVALRAADPGPALVDRACESFHAAFATRGSATQAALARASAEAESAARKRTALRAFADAAARETNTPSPAPADVRAIDGECHHAVLAPGTAVASRAPYLTDATDHSVTVNFATDAPVTAPAVWFGPDGTDCHTDEAVATRQPQVITIATRVDYLFAVTIRGLGPGTPYCYSLAPPVLDISTQSKPAQFVTAYSASDPRPFSFAVLGDWGGGGADEARVLEGIASSKASFVVTTGDNAYIDGTQTDYGDLEGGNVFGASYWPAVGRSRPAYATSGNHGFSNFRAALQNWPEDEVVRRSQGRQGRDRYCCTATLSQAHTYASTWYAFDWGPARFYVLDAAFADSTGSYDGDFLAHWNGAVAGCEPCGAERKWLEADLGAHRSTPLKFAFFHFPLYSDASDHLSDTHLDGSSALEGLLARNGVDIVFNGHAHLYERNVPMISGSPMLSYVSGGGGVNDLNDKLAAVQRCSAFDAYAIGLGPSACHAPKPSADSDAYHFLLVTVDGHRVTVTPTNESGATFDVHTWKF